MGVKGRKTMSAPHWSDARNVLCVRLDTIGDVLMTGPALRALRAAVPGRRVTLLTSPAGAAAAALMPDIDETLAYVAPWMKPARDSEPAPDLELIERLREARFDAAAIFTVYTQSALPAALVCQLAAIPLRLARTREKPYGLLTDWVPETEPENGVRHEVRRQLDLVAEVGAGAADEGLALRVPEAARRRVRALLTELRLGERWVAVHPGSTAESRRYPHERWAAVCGALEREHGIAAVLTGAPEEADLAESVIERAGAGVSVAGQLDLAELAALLEAAPLLLAGNTGPVHVAAAVGTPTVDVYALTNPQHTPWGVPATVLFEDVPCRWCFSSVCLAGHHRCVRGVEPERVVEAALALLRGEPPPALSLPPVPAGTPRSRPRAPPAAGS
jgi:lipopolysaccharide heptosyltransferase II